MDKRYKNIGVAIVFVSILLIFTVIIAGTSEQIFKEEIEDKEISYKENNLKLEQEFNNVREGNLTEDLTFLVQTNINHKYGSKLSKEKLALISNLTFPVLFKRDAGFSKDIMDKGLYINNNYEDNNQYIQALLALNLSSNHYVKQDDFSKDGMMYNEYVSLYSMIETKNLLLGPDVAFTPSSFNFMNNQNLVYMYDPQLMKYDVGKTIYELPNNQIIGVYEEIYDAQLDGDLLYVYSNLISYKARYDFNLEGEEYTKDITLEIYNGVFKELNVKIKDYFEEEVNYALVNNGYKFMYVFKKASDGNYYFSTSMNIK